MLIVPIPINLATPLPAAAMLSRTDIKKNRPRAVLFCGGFSGFRSFWGKTA